jgi:hypothetical protein
VLTSIRASTKAIKVVVDSSIHRSRTLERGTPQLRMLRQRGEDVALHFERRTDAA